MKWLNTIRPSALCVGGLLFVLLMGMDTASAEPKWPLAPYTYFANHESLQDVLQKFAGGFSLSLHLNSGVRGLVNGKFTASSPTEFMDKLGGVYGFNWFVYAGNLFVSPTQAMVTKAVNVTAGSVSGLKNALKRLGVLDERFGWGEMNDQGLALVSGPPDYVKLIEKTIKELPLSSGNQEVAVFRLKYASVSDRVVSYRDKTVTTPGVETILRNLIGGTGAGTSGNEALASLAAPLRNASPYFLPGVVNSDGTLGPPMSAPLSGFMGNNNNNGASGAVKPELVGQRRSMARVQADARLNAIIVQDIPERIPIYRALIAQLDVPSTLIEIEAMIVDVRTSAVNQLGVRWGVGNGAFQFGFGGLGAGDANLHGGLGKDDPAGGHIGIGIGNAIIARIDALQKDQLANVLTRPSVLTTDNMRSVIDVNQTIYLKSSTLYTSNFTPVTTGTLLIVTPRYIQGVEGPEVELTVDINNGSVSDPNPPGATKNDNISAATMNTQVTTLATVQDGQALLIGGLKVSQDTKDNSKVPLLGDIPIIGHLFSSKGQQKENSERLILLRPRIVAVNGVPLVPITLQKWGNILDVTWGGNTGRPSKLDSVSAVKQYVDSAQALSLLTPNNSTRVYHVNDEDRNSAASNSASFASSRPAAQPVSTAPPSIQSEAPVSLPPVMPPEAPPVLPPRIVEPSTSSSSPPVTTPVLSSHGVEPSTASSFPLATELEMPSVSSSRIMHSSSSSSLPAATQSEAPAVSLPRRVQPASTPRAA